MLRANYFKKALFVTAVVGMALAGVVEAQVVTMLVAAGSESEWKYDDTDMDLYGAGWPSVDDSGWASGPAPLGFGDTHIVTVLTIGSPRHTCYFRHTFFVADPSFYESLTLRILRDDGCVVYLNGNEVARSNMTGGTINHETWSSAVVGGVDETTYFEYALDPSALIGGNNVLAVDVHQCNETSSDLGLDLELEAVGVDPHSPYQPTLVRPEDAAANVSTSPTLEVTVSDPDGQALDVSFFGRQLSSTAADFTIVALPDTQYYSESYPEMFTAQTQWIVDNASSHNIVFVTHEGDVVQTWDNVGQWENANTSMSLLDGTVPYGLCPGNHDDPTTYFNFYFSYTRYEGEPWYGGHYPDTGNDSNYELFSAGGMNFIILHMQVFPDQNVFNWANQVLSNNSNRVAIITTHQYMNTDGSRMTVGNDIYNNVVVPNDNVYFVFCGHNHAEATRTDIIGDRQVHQLLADYQGRSNGGDSWMRIMRFEPGENLVYVRTYAPYYNTYEQDGNSEFTLDFPMGDPFSVIGSDSGVPSPGNASVVWSDLSSGKDYEWFVEVTDTTNKTTVGPVWSFTTALTPEASNPNPPNGATGVDIYADLSWDPGIDAVSHDVYFGTINPPPFIKSQNETATTYDPGTMANDTIYYWRIDEFDGNVTHTGYVWSFTTASVPGQASNPSPANGATEVSITADLSWTAGSDTTSHDIYFGTNSSPPFVQNQSSTIFDPGLLVNDTTYHWRIDEIGPGGITAGDVWSFTTEPVPPELPWSDGFESGGFAAGGWTSSGDVSVRDAAAYSGSYGAQLKYTAWIEKAVSTVGFADIHIQYARKTARMDSGEFLYVEWSTDGSAWNQLEQTQDTSWLYKSFACDAGADNNAGFRVRFRASVDKVNEYAYVDDVQITGTPSGPDETPPTPDPMTWATVPYATGSTSISMTATTASDPSGVEYYFACTSGDGNDSGWQDGTIYVDTGLSPETTYTYTVKARDKSTNLNETVPSSAESATTDLPVPPGQASNPSPTSGAENVAVDVDLSWTAGAGTESHDVYFGTDALNLPLLSDSQSSTTFDPGILSNDTTYYWRIDEKNDNGTTPGQVWSFTTQSAGSTVYVSDITMDIVAGKKYYATATVQIAPELGEATVVGDWYFKGVLRRSGATGVTGTDGIAVLTSFETPAKSGDTFTFVVTDIMHSGYTYAPGDNVETQDSIDVP